MRRELTLACDPRRSSATQGQQRNECRGRNGTASGSRIGKQSSVARDNSRVGVSGQQGNDVSIPRVGRQEERAWRLEDERVLGHKYKKIINLRFRKPVRRTNMRSQENQPILTEEFH